ncbi:coiled-coil domain-containing protein 91 isoform X2 [Monodelphis domestica]|uniref:Coiled-coil domain containing 91 n=1 Tax=Monodelphis domestica TaxID=13616 RepID=A0A5F8HH24_MONDO|nr:coiled-coil domain-containing protein 91 isoform X2 [Monodelphis domestica]XP_056653640.1 coiled-coil domain-containing protein 91 isoform X2 [Monodelphis domestica]XP_056653641.1 coiled-coil domain-containing protein 91 isoform X2 [Monodelphis domestica]
MDDDDFGGFEAAETFDGGNGETHTTSPAIPWAAFPTVSGVHITPPVSPESILEQPLSSAHLISSKPIISSQNNALIVPQTGNNIVSHALSKDQVQQSTNTVDPSVSPLNLTDKKNNETVKLVDAAAEDHKAIGLNMDLREKIASLEVKLKTSEEEKQKIKKDLEMLLEKHRILEKDFLKDKEDEALSHQDRYKMLQEKHKHQLEDMRKAGHETLTIITEEYKALLQTTVQQQADSIEKQYISAIEKQACKCGELLNAQHQRLLDMLDAEKEQLTEKLKEALTQQSQEQKEILGKCLAEEMQRNKDALTTAAKIEKATMKDAILKAVEEERKKLGKVHAEERDLWKAEHDKDQEKVAQAIQEALQEQRKISQEILKEAMAEEQKRSEKAVEEAVRKTREELIEYVKEQKRLDQVIRQRSLSTLELFLSCAQKQLSSLISEEPASTEDGEHDKLASTDSR